MTLDAALLAAPILTPALASRLAALALDNVVREYPNKLDHVMSGRDDAATPRALHPAFYGSFDWHSCVHMHWTLARLARIMPALPEAVAIEALFDRHFSPEAIAVEVAYLARAGSGTFERPYGWAWLLKLAEELGRGEGEAFARWSRNLAPLADAFVARYLDWLPRARHPIRSGVHSSTAFGLAFGIDYARFAAHRVLDEACMASARSWYGADRDYPAAWEPSGSDFFSPALIEADLMRRVLDPQAFSTWLDAFLPGLARAEPATLFTPAEPGDRSDGQMVHLDGLSLSRAWCFRGIAAVLPTDDARRAIARVAADTHLVAGVAALANPHYMGTHWLASFALLALAEP